MRQRDKLIEILSQKIFPRVDVDPAEAVADYLLDNGVIVLPCKIGTHLWRVTYPYRKSPKVTEYAVKNFRSAGKKHRLQLEVQAIGVPGTNWMEFERFFTTKEAAEESLKTEALK